MIALVLAVFFAVGQASSPVSQKAFNKPTRASGVPQDRPSTNLPKQNRALVQSAPNERSVRIVGLPPRSTGDTVALFCTVILTIVGIFGIIAAFKTIRAIKKQSDAMVKSDRAWVMVDLEKVPIAGIVGEITTRDRGEPERHFRSFNVRCVCSNQGQTAARIVEKRCAVAAISGDDELPESPNLDIEIKDPIPHYLKANGDPWHTDWNIETEIDDSESIQLFVVYGVVRYRHLFSDKVAQTTFGYTVGFDGQLKRLIGKPKYNENE